MTRKINIEDEPWWDGGNPPSSAGWTTSENDTKSPYEHEYPLSLPDNVVYVDETKTLSVGVLRVDNSKNFIIVKDPKTEGTAQQ